MKKFLLLAPLLSFMLLLSGCGTKEVTPDGTTTQTNRPAVTNMGNTENTPDISDEPVTGETGEITDDTATGDVTEDSKDDTAPSLNLTIPPLKEINPIDTGDDNTLPSVKPNTDIKVTLPVQDKVGPIPPVETNKIPQL